MHGRSRFGAILIIVALLCGGALLTGPWIFHIGGQFTPLLTWTGSGKLVTKAGEYPLYVTFHPSSHFSSLHLDGLRPTGGLHGMGWLCTSRGVMQQLDLTGTIYNAWRTTDGSLVNIRLLEHQVINVGQGQGFFDLIGRWQGTQLVMDDRHHVPNRFRSGLNIEHASASLDWGSYSDFKAACAAMANQTQRPK